MHTKWLLTTAAALALVATPALAAGDSITNAMKNSPNNQSAGENAAAPSESQPADDSADAPAASSSQPPSDNASAGQITSDHSSSEKSIDNSDRDMSRSAGNGDMSGDMRSDMANDRHRHGRAMGQRRLRSALRDAGFTDVRVLDAKYLIQAKDHDGNTVFMAINPPSASRRGETTGFDHHAKADRQSGMSRGDMNEFADDGGESGYNGAGAQGARHGVGRNGGGEVYERGYDEGFREGYARGYDRGYGN